MAIAVLTNCLVKINSVDLSDHVRQINISHAAKTEAATVMGNDTENFLAGLKVSSIEVEFLQDQATGKVDQTLFPLVGPGVAPFIIEIAAVNTTISATNKRYNFYAMLESYPPLGVSVGGIAAVKATFRPAGGTQATLLASIT